MRVGFFVWIDHDHIRSLSVAFNTVILYLCALLQRWLKDCLIWIQSDVFADNYFCHVHLLQTVWKFKGIVIRVGAIIGKVNGFPPHTNLAVINVEAFFTLVNNFRLSLSCSMEQVFNYNWALIFKANIFFFMFEDSPKFVILYSHNFIDNCIRHWSFEFINNHLNFLSLTNINYFAEFLLIIKLLNNIIPCFRKLVRLNFIENLYYLLFDLLIFETSDLDFSKYV